MIKLSVLQRTKENIQRRRLSVGGCRLAPLHTHSHFFTKEKLAFYMVLLGLETKDQKSHLYPHFPFFLFPLFFSSFLLFGPKHVGFLQFFSSSSSFISFWSSTK
jgi:hypothetical protein